MTSPPTSAGAPSAASIRQGDLTILILTRGRPELLAEVFQSLRANTARKDQVAVWLHVDDDDEITLQAMRQNRLPDCGLAVHWNIGPRPTSLGEAQEALWRASGRTSQICVTGVDDAAFATPGWDDLTRAKFDEYPDGVLLAFPHDPMTADMATYPILGWNWIRTLGTVYPTYFPYWFGDKWLDQIGRMVGRCAKVPISLDPIGGKGRTKRMRNLPFWTLFFHLTLEERKDAARKLVDAIYERDSSGKAAALANIETAALPFVKEKQDYSDAYCVFQEERFSESSAEERDRFDPKLFKAECGAVSRLVILAQEAIEKKKYAEALEFLDAIRYSDVRARAAQLLAAQCLRMLGREQEAERIARDTLAAWPQSNLLRRTFRFLGMVANDGKRMLVGLTAKGKKG